jgi:hypothetical protein
MLLPKLVPAGSSYVRVPVSKRACMRILLETVQRGSRFWCAGNVAPDKALGFADKMARMYRADANQAQRAYAKRRGHANTTLVMYPDTAATILWWLLVTQGVGSVHECERLADAHAGRSPLVWQDQYLLRHVQRPRAHGGGRTWTWSLLPQRMDALMSAMRQAATAPGAAHARTDDLHELVHAVMRMPGYYGVRQQQLELLRVGREVWERTHATGVTFPWPERVPYLDKGFGCYHRPEPLRLDTLVRILAARSMTDSGTAPGRGALDPAGDHTDEDPA